MAVVLAALNGDVVEKLVVGLLVVFVVGAVLVVRSGLKLVFKLVTIAVLLGLGMALFQNRAELGRCSQTCSCTIYGHDVEVPHLPFSCNY